MRRLRGFSMLEMLVALSISAVVVAVGTQVIVQMIKATKRMAVNAQLDSESQALTEALLAEAQGVGGGSLRPAGAVLVSNRKAGDAPPATDELTMLTLDDSKNPCSIASFNGSNKAIFLNGGVCCVNTQFTNNNLIAVVSPSGNSTGVQLFSPLGSSCKMGLSPTNFPSAINAAAVTSQFTSGSAMVVRQRRYVLDDATHQLQVVDTDLTGTSRTRVLAENVYDFQVALGYDVPSPARDGLTTDTGGTDDEWLYNAVGDQFGPGAPTPLVSGTTGDLQRIAIGVTVGVRQLDGGGNTAQMLDGPPITVAGVYLRSSVSRVTFRNLFLFQ